VIFVAFWPAMWVDPLGILAQVFGQAADYAVGGHAVPIFFNGRRYSGDPGAIFYPVTFLWRTTPVILIGLILLALYSSNPQVTRQKWKSALLALGAYIVLFLVFMTLGAKKFDRYLLPIYAPVAILAGAGWLGAVRHWLARFARTKFAPGMLVSALIFLLGFQALGVFQTAPYYLSYFNPLMGGRQRAAQVMQIGWGEGLDEAARYLNTKPNATAMQVISWYPDGVFSYFFDGQTNPLYIDPEEEHLIEDWQHSDYLVLYIHQWQRGLPSDAFLSYFAALTPEKVIQIDGFDYAQIYDISDIEPPPNLFR
jgi:hypothetical protein